LRRAAEARLRRHGLEVLTAAEETLTKAAQGPKPTREVFYNLGEVKFAKGATDEAADGEEALRIARAERLDLVLLDVVMPKLEGFEVLKLLKEDEATASIPVIVLSNLGQERDVAQAKALGAVAFLVKAHLSLQDLVDRVDAVLATGTT